MTRRSSSVAAGDGADDAPQLVGGGGGAREAAVLLREAQEHEAQPAVLGEEVLAGEIAERGERCGHAGPR